MATYGEGLPDSIPLVSTRTSSQLALVPALSSFLAGLAHIHRKASTDASAHIGSFRLHIARSAAERGGEQASLERALAGVLEQCDLQVRETGVYADKLAREVAARMDEVGQRLDAVRKKHHSFYGKLMSQRDKAYEQRDRSRAAYFSACDALESARQRKAGAKEGRDSEKATRAYDAAHVDMLLAKDQYLLDVDAANEVKRRVYEVHLPAVHDEFQLLEASAVHQLEHLVERVLALQREAAERVLGCVAAAQEALSLVDIESDQQAFVDQHSRTLLAAYEHPPDLVFEESPVWHDTDEFDTSPPAMTYLQNVKGKALSRLGDISPAIDSKRREVSGLRNLRETYERETGLGDTVGVIENLFNVSHETTLLELQQSELKATVELIDATLGDDASTGLRPHEFKPSSFVTPSTCAVCESSVWGKGLKCEKCSMSVHTKCELKVPAGCAARPGAGVVRAKSKKGGGVATPATGGSTTSLSRTMSTTSGTSSMSSGPPPRRAVGPPGSMPPPSASPPVPPSSSSSSPVRTVTLLYPYTAATSFELTLPEGDVGSVLELLEDEDESGWIKVRVPTDGREGLVPGSYVQEGGALPGGGSVGTGGKAASRGAGAAERVVALYDYAPQSGDELALREGEEVELTSTGFAAGEGWAEVSKDGRTGLVPASYIQTV
ncbi:Bzz1p [Rhodotorula paludigena]|uniref:Bzz1p n=1 Tax=Rhodotorula paludigena TaxID=86838 RepID=UPI003176CF88